jgi:prepilin-type N-terminal cleavage/methylation domain-containing protein
MKTTLQHGFTLIEIVIVLLIVTILLGYTVAMYPMQQELKQYRQLRSEMDQIIEHLIGYAQVNGRLPCPDTTGDVNGTGVAGVNDGQEDLDDEIINATGVAGNDGLADGCKGYFGFLPAGTLGMNGDIDTNGNLLDPWGQPYAYHVSDFDFNSVGGAGGADLDLTTGAAIDLVSPDGIGEEGLSNVIPDLVVCDDSDNASAADTTCAAVSATDIVTNAVAVIISSGKDRGQVASNIQDENRDDFNDGTNDFVYTSSTRNDAAGSEYDDLVRWISPNLLYTKMIEAGRLP